MFACRPEPSIFSLDSWDDVKGLTDFVFRLVDGACIVRAYTTQQEFVFHEMTKTAGGVTTLLHVV